MIDHDPLPVLVVDDDPCTLMLMSAQLRKVGHTVYEAGSGVEALKILTAQGPPIIVTDWIMAGMDGLELCRAIRSHDGIRYAFVIVMTAQTEDDRIVEAFEAGADDYLTKPWKNKELLARLRGGQRIIRLQQDLDRRNLDMHRVNAEMAIAQRKIEEANEKLQLMATTDELTGLFNRREAMQRLRDLWAMYQRHGDPLSCVMLDIDHFKRFNDTHGHAVGDIVLKNLAKLLRSGARTADSVCRIGGEEFLILCPKTTEETAGICAERIRRDVEANTIDVDDQVLRMTISLGVAEAHAASNTPDALIKEADTALYVAKSSGRNRVVLARDHASIDSKTEQPAERGSAVSIRCAETG